jgi:hypothetical protein
LFATVKVPVNALGETVNVAASLGAVWVPLQLFVNTARYLFPLIATPGFVSVRVPLVAPETSVQLPPPSVLNCHWTVGVGDPPASAENDASAAYSTV